MYCTWLAGFALAAARAREVIEALGRNNAWLCRLRFAVTVLCCGLRLIDGRVPARSRPVELVAAILELAWRFVKSLTFAGLLLENPGVRISANNALGGGSCCLLGTGLSGFRTSWTPEECLLPDRLFWA